MFVPADPRVEPNDDGRGQGRIIRIVIILKAIQSADWYEAEAQAKVV
jgi:hypothetical protein